MRILTTISCVCVCVCVCVQMSVASGNESSVWVGQEMMSDILVEFLTAVHSLNLCKTHTHTYTHTHTHTQSHIQTNPHTRSKNNTNEILWYTQEVAVTKCWWNKHFYTSTKPNLSFHFPQLPFFLFSICLFSLHQPWDSSLRSTEGNMTRRQTVKV